MKTEINETLFDITFKSPENDVFKVYEFFKAIKGFDRVPMWDKVNANRHLRPAKKLLELCKEWETPQIPAYTLACYYIKEVGGQMDKKKLSWTIETCLRATPEFRAKQMKEMEI